MPKFSGDKRKKEKEEKDDSSSDSGPDDDPPPKKEKTSDKPAKKSSSSNDEEASFPLSKNKFVKVRTYQGNVMVDIREFYMAGDGDLRPGKKGITLNPAQWEQFKNVIKEVDAAVKERM